MTNDQLAASIDALNAKLDREFGAIEKRFVSVESELRILNTRLDHTVTKADVFVSVLQALGLLVAASIGTVVVLNAVGAFS